MSIISNRHSVVPFVAGTSKPFPEQRLAKVGYKSSKANPAKFPSVCASVPTIAGWSENQSARLKTHFVQLLADTQDKIFRSLYESSDGSILSIGDDEISVDQCIAYLEAESTGDRLTKERIVEWFNDNVSDNLSVVICEKLSVDNPDDLRVQQTLNAYRGLFGSLSKDSGALQEKQVTGLRKAIEVSAVDDEIAKRLDGKLAAMLNRPKLEELLEL